MPNPIPRRVPIKRTSRLVLARSLREGDEIAFHGKQKAGIVRTVVHDGEARLTITTSTHGARTVHLDDQVIRWDPKPTTQADQRRPR